MGLDRLHRLEVSGVEQLGAVEGQGQIRFGANHLRDARRRAALPVGTSNQEGATAVPGGTAAEIGEVVGVEIDQLDAPVALLLDRGHGEHDRLPAQIQAHPGVGRVGVWGLHGRVGRGVDARNVEELVVGRLVVGVGRIDEVGVLDAVVVHHREAIHVGIPGDLANFSRRWHHLSHLGNNRQRDSQQGSQSGASHRQTEGADPPIVSWRMNGCLQSIPIAQRGITVMRSMQRLGPSPLSRPAGHRQAGRPQQVARARVGQLLLHLLNHRLLIIEKMLVEH